MSTGRAVVVLAAGKGKRMKSDIPKVMHQVNGRPIIRILMDTLLGLGFDRIVVVVGHGGELVQTELADLPVKCVWQREQLGTGHAVKMALPELEDFEGTVLVALGDVPFLSSASFEQLMGLHESSQAAATCLSAIVDDPTGYGRVVRVPNSDMITGIVEHKEAAPEVLTINEINTGTICFEKQALVESLQDLSDDNAQGEYYLTDTIKVLHNKGLRVAALSTADPHEWRGINSVEQLEFLASKFA